MHPAGWYPDPEWPTGRWRWWDGTGWTAHVVDGTPMAPSTRSTATGPVPPAASADAVAAPTVPAPSASGATGAAAPLSEADRTHLVEYYLGQYHLRWYHSWSTEGETYFPDETRAWLDAAFGELERRLPPDEPPLDVFDDRIEAGSLLVVTARRLLLLNRRGSERAAPEAVGVVVDEEVFERLTVRGLALLDGRPERTADGLEVHLGKAERQWLGRFIAGPRCRQGRLLEILGRPRRRAQDAEPGWYPDPGGEYEQRFWDGTVWTHSVFLCGSALRPAGVYERPLPARS